LTNQSASGGLGRPPAIQGSQFDRLLPGNYETFVGCGFMWRAWTGMRGAFELEWVAEFTGMRSLIQTGFTIGKRLQMIDSIERLNAIYSI
jgi:hypothetical protein